MKYFAIVGTALACVLAAMSASAQGQPPSPEEQAANAVATRQSVFKLLSWNFGPMGGMLRGNVDFDADVVATNAGRIAVLGGMIPDVFANDTTAFDVETRALDSIWGNKASFEEKAGALVTAADALAEAAGSGDEGATRAAIGAVGQACGSCHDDFRAE